MKIPLLGQTGQSTESVVQYQKTQNWYPHIEQEGVSQLVLMPTPGLSVFSTTSTGPVRGMIKYNDLLYVVSAGTVWEISSAGAVTSRGTISTTTGRVSMAHNGADNGGQIMIVDGTDGYICDGATTTAIADAQFPANVAGSSAPTHVVFFDGYFLVNDPGITGRFNFSDSYDGTAWTALNFATAERDPDALQSIIVTNRLFWLIGEFTAEPWFNSGGEFPFEPVQSGFIEWGTPAPHSPAEMDGNLFYLGQSKNGDKVVLQVSGTQPSIISDSISGNLHNLTTLSDAYGYTYQYDGHGFYVLTFPTDEKTFVYDIKTKMWHEWVTASTGHHISNNHVFCYNKHLVGSTETGAIYELDWDIFTDAGEVITRIRHGRVLLEDRITVHEGVWLDMKEGVGNATVPDPQIMLRFKDNDGAWSNEKWRSIGAIGKYNTRVIWRRLGRSRNRLYELKITDAVRAVLVQAYSSLNIDEDGLT